MTDPALSRPFPIERPAAGVGAAFLAVCAAAGFGLAPGAAAPALRFAAVACLQPALGCLIFLLIYRITGGQWGEPIRPMLRAGARLLPWIWPVLGAISLLRAARTDLPLLPHARPMPGVATLAIRAVGYEIMFLALNWVALNPRGKRFAAPGLIVLTLGGHCLAADQFFVLEPGWYSSAFPLVWLSISAAAGMALAIPAAIGAGMRPGEPGSAGRAVGLDLGNLLLTSVIFATYVAFMEFLIIWSGNLPREISWFERRSRGVWGWTLVILVAFHLAFPFLLLLQRQVKKRAAGLCRVAGLVFAAEALWALWLVIPAFGDRGPWIWPLCAGFLAGGAGLFLNRFLRFCREGGAAP